MMTRAAAEAYGKSIGCKYYVVNNYGGLYGGFTTLDAAKACLRKWLYEDRLFLKSHPEYKLYIEERKNR